MTITFSAHSSITWLDQPIRASVLALYVARSMNPFHVRHFNLRYFSGVLVLCFIVSCENNLFYWNVSTDPSNFNIRQKESRKFTDFAKPVQRELLVFVKTSGSRSKVTVNRVLPFAFLKAAIVIKGFPSHRVSCFSGPTDFPKLGFVLVFTKGGLVSWNDATIDSI